MIIKGIKERREFPMNILWSAAFLTIVGLIILRSISQHSDDNFFRNPFLKQILFLVPAVLLCLIVYYTPRFLIHKYAYNLYLFGIMIIILPFFGSPQAGTFRWLDLGLPFTVQPSEFAKIFTIIALARYLSDHNLKMKNFSSVIIPLVLGLAPTVIILQQPDLGTAIIMLTPLLPMLYWAGSRFFHLFLLLAPIFSMLTAFHTIAFSAWASLLAMVIFLSRPTFIMSILLFFGNIFLGLLSPALWNNFFTQYQRSRILTLFNPDKDPLGAAYQIIQSKTAIGSGGLFGKGWGDGTQTHLKFLPVQESDFILSVMGEELGFIAISSVLIVFGYLCVNILKYSYQSKDRFSSLAMIGCGTVYMSHVFVNTAMTVGLIPVKGLPFPFVSAGGSFLLTSYLMLGLILKLSNNYAD